MELARPGSHVAFSIRSYFYEDEGSGFKQAQQVLVDESRLELMGCQERPYLPKEDVEALYFLYRVR